MVVQDQITIIARLGDLHSCNLGYTGSPYDYELLTTTRRPRHRPCLHSPSRLPLSPFIRPPLPLLARYKEHEISRTSFNSTPPDPPHHRYRKILGHDLLQIGTDFNLTAVTVSPRNDDEAWRSAGVSTKTPCY